LRADLKAAGVPYATQGPDGPEFFDMHALRHWFCTQVANLPGISPKTLQTLTRHSTVELAMKVYAKAKRDQLKEAVRQIQPPGMVAPKVAPEALPDPNNGEQASTKRATKVQPESGRGGKKRKKAN